MNVEIVEFYPLEENKSTGFLSGTLKARLPEQEIIIMGIFVSRSKGRYFFNMPGRMGTHHETGKKIRYPAIVFEDHEKQKALMETIREKGETFIEAKIADPKRPLAFPPKPQPAPTSSKSVSQGEGRNSQQKSQEPKQTQTAPKPSKAHPIKPISKLDFRDPPKRPTSFTKNKYAKSTR